MAPHFMQAIYITHEAGQNPKVKALFIGITFVTFITNGHVDEHINDESKFSESAYAETTIDCSILSDFTWN